MNSNSWNNHQNAISSISPYYYSTDRRWELQRSNTIFPLDNYSNTNEASLMYELQEGGVASLNGYRDNGLIQNEGKGKNQRQSDIRKFIVSIKDKKESIATLKQYSEIIELKKETNELSIHFGREGQILGKRNAIATFNKKLIRAFKFQGDNPVQRERDLFNRRKWKRTHDQKNRIARMQANRFHLEFQNNQTQVSIPQVPTYIYNPDDAYVQNSYIYKEDEYISQPYTESCALYQPQPQLQFSEEYNLNGSCNQFSGRSYLSI